MGKRLDIALVEKGMVTSRERAKELIKNGGVLINGKVITKPSFEVTDIDNIIITAETLKYVGRGGLKLEAAIEKFSINLTELTCLDIGASTGGFTDCMLQNGAKKVYAVDVGHSQLADKLLPDKRVINMENTDIRAVTSDNFSDEIDFIATDVSFISLKLILPCIKLLLKANGFSVVLIKPQFEAGKQNIGKKGIVKDKKVHINVVNDIYDFTSELGFTIRGICPSPVKGGSGNIEYLMLLQKSNAESICLDCKEIVNSAFGLI